LELRPAARLNRCLSQIDPKKLIRIQKVAAQFIEPDGDRRKTSQVQTIGGTLEDVQLSDAKRVLFHKGVLYEVSPKVQRLGSRVSDRVIAM